jgi:hydrogenase-4 component E
MTLLTVLLSLRSNQLKALVKLMAFQGILVSSVPLFLETEHGLSFGIFIFFLLLVLIKGIVIPGLLYKAVKKIAANREIIPIIGYHASLFIGLIMIVCSVYIAGKLQLSMPEQHKLLMITAISTMGAGFLLMMARRMAITQVIGYLMMENGIYLIGTSLAKRVHTQYVVEFAVLLDLLVAILVMGIVLANINRTFDDINTDLLGQLKD